MTQQNLGSVTDSTEEQYLQALQLEKQELHNLKTEIMGNEFVNEQNNIMENEGPGTTIAQAIDMYVDEHGYNFCIIMCRRYISKSSE